jgi:hypothetical protein
MRTSLALLLVACGSSPGATPDATVATQPDAPVVQVDGPPAATGFGDLSGQCGVLTLADFANPQPSLVRATMTFATEYVDADDRSMLTPGGQRMMMTPNAGGSSGLSEAFAFEELARCEHADLLKTETEIVYSTPGKITDLSVSMMGHTIGVSVTRAVAFPFGDPYTVDTANTLIARKLSDIQTSSADVSTADKWDKQILAILAWDDAAADSVTTAWNALDAGTKANTIVLITVTNGADMFIYTNQ